MILKKIFLSLFFAHDSSLFFSAEILLVGNVSSRLLKAIPNRSFIDFFYFILNCFIYPRQFDNND